MKMKTSFFAIAVAAVLLLVTAPVLASNFHHIHVPAINLVVNNLQDNYGDMDAETTVSGIRGRFGPSATQRAGDDASISSAAIGNNLSLNVRSSGMGLRLRNHQDNYGDMDAETTVSGMSQIAGDDASISAAAIGNNASVTLGGLDL